MPGSPHLFYTTPPAGARMLNESQAAGTLSHQFDGGRDWYQSRMPFYERCRAFGRLDYSDGCVVFERFTGSHGFWLHPLSLNCLLCDFRFAAAARGAATQGRHRLNKLLSKSRLASEQKTSACHNLNLRDQSNPYPPQVSQEHAQLCNWEGENYVPRGSPSSDLSGHHAAATITSNASGFSNLNP